MNTYHVHVRFTNQMAVEFDMDFNVTDRDAAIQYLHQLIETQKSMRYNSATKGGIILFCNVTMIEVS